MPFRSPFIQLFYFTQLVTDYLAKGWLSGSDTLLMWEAEPDPIPPVGNQQKWDTFVEESIFGIKEIAHLLSKWFFVIG
ncbi:MAG: hypothetical protein VYE19_08250, partial [Chloroflexota bacterium]|nr:hypothetical protein [Chloroflexota bacterium]